MKAVPRVIAALAAASALLAACGTPPESGLARLVRRLERHLDGVKGAR